MSSSRRRKAAARKMRLTELSVRKAKPGARAYLIWDAGQRGLALRVQPTGSRVWVVVYSHHNRPRWLTLGDATSIPLGEARTMAAEAMLAVAKGKDPGAEKRAERGAGTFADLAVRYVEHAKRVNKSWPQAARLVERYVLPRWGRLQATDISRADVRALLGRMIEAPVLANQVLASISAIYSWGVKQEILATNPCRGVDRNKTQSRERVLSDSEVPAFWQAFDDVGGLVIGAALKVALLTGQRIGEVVNMRREHIADGWWEMPGDPVPALGWPGTKNGASHRVWLPKPIQEIIAELGDGYVFEGPRGGPLTVGGVDAAMRDIVTKLGAERATPHDLRRTHGSAITALGFGRDAMNRIQNHREGGITSVYDRHGYADENRRIMETVAAKFMALVDGAPTGKVVQLPRR